MRIPVNECIGRLVTPNTMNTLVAALLTGVIITVTTSLVFMFSAPFEYPKFSRAILHTNPVDKDAVQKKLLTSPSNPVSTGNSTSRERISQGDKTKAIVGIDRNESSTTPKTILFWTTFFGMRDFQFGLGRKPFKDARCDVDTCVTTADKSQFNQSAAVIFHMRNVDARTQFPTLRQPGQSWVFFLQESPMHQWNNLKQFNGIFNLTMTYRKDSDIQLLYGQTIRSIPSSPSLMRLSLNNPGEKSFKEKKLVAWFVSNCVSHSKRETYVKELQKYIDVDIYGECGTFKCPEGGTLFSRRMDPKCYEMLEEEYKFYLSFENAFCKDYVTEKVFNILKLNVVPVVMGLTNYSRDLPPGSYIDVMDFRSPKALANFLKELGKDEERYKQYLKWKSDFNVVSNEAFAKGFCDLCKYLHNPNNPNKVLDHLDTWWGKDVFCDNQLMQQLMTKW